MGGKREQFLKYAGQVNWFLPTRLAPPASVALAGRESPADNRAELQRVREAVWHAWFANDKQALENLAPVGTIVISAGERKWKNRSEVPQSAASFQAEGGRLVHLDFPCTEVQQFDDVAILYSRYRLEISMGAKHKIDAGRVTEIFMRRNGHWTNPVGTPIRKQSEPSRKSSQARYATAKQGL